MTEKPYIVLLPPELPPVVRNPVIEEARKLFTTMTNDERMLVFSEYCCYCGCANPGCQCWNDE